MSVKDGFIEVSNFKGRYVFGSLATYHCNPGYILWGNASRLCAEDGIWTGIFSYSQPTEVNQKLISTEARFFYYSKRERKNTFFGRLMEINVSNPNSSDFLSGKKPQCKPITCGQPPEVLNARFQLTNGTSTSWQSLARYTCKLGFKMIYQNRKCQKVT